MDGDVIIINVVNAQGPMIEANWLVLTSLSSVIEEKLESGILNLYEFSSSYEKVSDCLRLLSGEEVEITLANAGTFLKFAVIYKVDMLYKRCVKEVQNFLSPKSFAKFLELAELVDNLARDYPEEERNAAVAQGDGNGDDSEGEESSGSEGVQFAVGYGKDLMKACKKYINTINEMPAEFLQEAFDEIKNEENERRFVGLLIENFFDKDIAVFVTSWVDDEGKAQWVIEKLDSTLSSPLTLTDETDNCMIRLIVKLSSFNSTKCVQNCSKIIMLQVGLIETLKYFPLNKKREIFLRMLCREEWKNVHFCDVLSYNHNTEVKHFEYIEVMLAWIGHHVKDERVRPSQAKITTFWETIVAEKLSMTYEHDLRMHMVKVWRYKWPKIAVEVEADYQCITYASNFQSYMLDDWVENKALMISNKSKDSTLCGVVDCVKESKHWVKLQLKNNHDNGRPCYKLEEELLRFDDDDERHYHALSTTHWWLIQGYELVSMVTNNLEFINGIIGPCIVQGAAPDQYLLLNNKNTSISCMVKQNVVYEDFVVM